MDQRILRRGKIDPEHEEVLRKRYSLLKDIDPSHITDKLLETNVIDFDDMDQISSKTTTKDKREVLIQKIRFSGENSFYRFLHVLTETGYKHIAEELEKELSEKSTREYYEFKTGTTNTSLKNIQKPVENYYTGPVSLEYDNNESIHSYTKKPQAAENYDYENAHSTGNTVFGTKENTDTQKVSDVSDCRLHDSSPSDFYFENPVGKVYHNEGGSDEHIYTKLQRLNIQQDTRTEKQQTKQHHEENKADTNEYELPQPNSTTDIDPRLDDHSLPIPCKPAIYNNIPYENLKDQMVSEPDTSNVKRRSKQSQTSCDKHQIFSSESGATSDKSSSSYGYRNRTSTHSLVQPLYIKGYKKPISDSTTLKSYNHELRNIDGWYAGITEDNFCDVIQENIEKIGHYFIWYSKEKHTVIVTIIESPEAKHIKVKSRDQQYYFSKNQQFKSVKDLIVHITHNASVEL